MKSKKLDDNSPTKNDVKGAKGLAQLVKDGRYAEPTTARCLCRTPCGKENWRSFNRGPKTVQGQMHNWIDRNFPEFLKVFKKWEGKAALQFLQLYALPHEIADLLIHLRKTAK